MAEETIQVVVEPVQATEPVSVASALEPLSPSPEVSVEVSPVVETAPASASILGEALNASEQISTDVVDVAPVETKETEGQSEDPAPLPSFEPFVLPEGISLEDGRLDEFTSMLGQFTQETKVDQIEVQKLGQSLLNYHIAEVQKAAALIAEQYQTLQSTENLREREQWKSDFLNHPELGGNRQQTTVNAALQFIRTHGGTPEQQAEFSQLMDKTGVGNHPAVIRLLANAGIAMSEGRPLTAQTPISAPVSKIQKMYGGRTA